MSNKHNNKTNQTTKVETPQQETTKAETPQQETTKAETTQAADQMKEEQATTQEQTSQEPTKVEATTSATNNVVQEKDLPATLVRAEPVKVEPKEVVNTARVLKADPVEATTTQQILEKAKTNVKLNTLAATLESIEMKLSVRSNISMDDVAKNMVGLHNCLLTVINSDKTVEEFKEQWNYVCKFFEEKKKDGLGLHRLYRGVAYWSKSREEYMHFQSLVNLIYLTNNKPETGLLKNMDFNKIVKHPVTEQGRGRLSAYYLM